MGKYITGIFLFLLMLTVEEFRIGERDDSIKKLEQNSSNYPSSIQFSCVKCGAPNTRSIFEFSDSIEQDSSKIFKNIHSKL